MSQSSQSGSAESIRSRGFRTPLGEKIFLDRYALKSSARDAFKVGDTVVFSPEVTDGYSRREIGIVKARDDESQMATLVLRDNPGDESGVEEFRVPFEHVDTPLETDYDAMCRRVAGAIASVEPTTSLSDEATAKFEDILSTRDFVPGGRILAGAGAPGDLTYYNCFVIPSPKDSRAGILKTAQQQFEIMSRGGGVGINVSSLRPKYDYVKGVNGRSSGAVSWADLYSIITGKVEQGGSRRGALMIILDVWHPDIRKFVTAKHKIGTLDNANISVGVTDDFMAAVEADGEWTTLFPDRDDPDYDELWDGDLKSWIARGKKVNKYETFKARELFHEICQSAWASAEPGLFFVDRYNRMANSNYYTQIRCTNPCGEQGLPPWGVCNLGALNLGNYVKATADGASFWEYAGEAELPESEVLARIDIERLADRTRKAVHFLDNVIDKTPYVMRENEEQQKGERRVGLGIMGFAEMLVRAGVRYGSPLSVQIAEQVFRTIRDAAYESSIELARRKGPFPRFRSDGVLASGFASELPETLREGIRRFGLRNVTLTTIAPTGTTGSMTATSTGIEPYFMFRFEQRGHLGAHVVEEPIVREFRAETGEEGKLPPHFVVTEDLTPDDHVGIMATAQRYIDSSISKTCNLPNDFTVEDVESFYRKLYELGCKGGTVYRDGSRQEQCLVKIEDDAETAAEMGAEVAVPAAAAKPAVTVEPKGPLEEVKPMPAAPRVGLTHSVKTHLGRVHVTLNLDIETDQLFDVFIRLSKAGSDIDADTDAIGRLVSLILRINSHISTQRRLQLVIDQLRGIASSMSIGFGQNRVRSVPDGIALCLQTLLDKVEQLKSLRRFEQQARAEAEGGQMMLVPKLFNPDSDETRAIRDDDFPADRRAASEASGAPAVSAPAVSNPAVTAGSLNGSANGTGSLNGAGTATATEARVAASTATASSAKARGFILTCPACACASAVKADGCFKCMSCGYSEC